MKIAPKFAAGLAVLCAFASFAALPAAALAQNIGTINIQKVFSDLREVKDIKGTFTQKGQQLEAQKTAAESRVKSLTDQRALFAPGSAEYSNINNEIVKAATEAQITLQIAQQELLIQQKTLTKQVFDKIDASVAKLAQEKQLVLVISQLSTEITPELFERATPDQLNQALFSRSVLYSSPSIDITPEIITRMDAGYAANPTPAPTPSPTPAPTPAPAR